MVNHAFILLPLYIYPLPGAWDPLFNAAKANPTVTFQAVINPYSGPNGPCPDASYINATSYLNTIPNIKTLAYVHVNSLHSQELHKPMNSQRANAIVLDGQPVQLR